MTPAVLITRSEPGASVTAKRVAEAGFAPILTPMLRISPLPIPATLPKVQAILVTSANAARRLEDVASRPTRVLTVGGATADAARAAGAQDVTSADGDVVALAALAQRTLDPKAGPLLHWRGREVAGDLAGALRAAGFEVLEQLVYAAEPALSLTPDAERALKDGTARAVLFHSARGARAFVDVVKSAGLTEHLRGVVAVSLSAEASGPARGTAFAGAVSAVQPLEMSLIEALTAALNRPA